MSSLLYETVASVQQRHIDSRKLTQHFRYNQGWVQLINIRANVEKSVTKRGHIKLFIDGCHTQ